MSYFHVIYNSSQKNIEGGIGFGFRTMSEDIPESYKQALYDSTNQDLFFIYKYGTYVYPSPTALFENKDKVLNFPKGYAFSKIKTNDGNSFYILERIIPVGFDYTFYLKNTPGRLGNYVVDSYIFPEIPSREAFEMLYENPCEDSNYFIPKSPVPDQNNEEMKSLSLGSASLLPKEEKAFASKDLGTISDVATELLFAYIESRKKKKKLIIKYAWDNIASLLADFIRLLPDEEIQNAKFCTNYHYEGLQEAFQIICINEYYQYEIPAQGIFVNLSTGNIVKTKERDTFITDIKNDISRSNLESVHKQVAWMLSEAYTMVEEKSTDTNKIIYSYCIDKANFDIKKLLSNNEAIDVLKSYLSNQKEESKLLIRELCGLFSSCQTISDYASIIGNIELLRSKGFDISEVIIANKKNVTDFMLQDSKRLLECIKKIGWDYLKVYAIKEECENNKELIKESILFDYWIELYPYFYSKSDLENKQEFVLDLFRTELPVNIRKKVLSREVEPKTLVEVYINSILRLPSRVKTFEQPLFEAMEEARDTSTDLINCFHKHIEDVNFSNIFFFQFNRIRLTGNPLDMLSSLNEYLEKNKELKIKVAKSLQEIPVYNAIYNAIKLNTKRYDKSSIIASIERYILSLNNGSNKAALTKWYYIKTVVEEKVENIEQSFNDIYKLTIEMHSKEYFRKLAPVAFRKYNTVEVVKNMEAVGLNENEMVNLAIDNITETNKKYDYVICIYKHFKRDFKFVYNYTIENNIKNKEELLNKYYPKEYKSLCKKERIKRFFSSIFSVFKRKKK